MTTAQITHVLGERGYSVDAWIDLADFPLINMGQDTNLYTDASRIRLNFNTTTENLELVYGTLSGSTFTSNSGETSGYTPESFVPFSALIAFISSVVPGPQGTYYKKYFGNARRLDYTQN
jgi:hypothetical protein